MDTPAGMDRTQPTTTTTAHVHSDTKVKTVKRHKCSHAIPSLVRTMESVTTSAKTTSVPVQKVSAAMIAKPKISQKTRVTLTWQTYAETVQLVNQFLEISNNPTTGGANAHQAGKVNTVPSRNPTTCVTARKAGPASSAKNRLLTIVRAVKTTIPAIMMEYVGLKV